MKKLLLWLLAALFCSKVLMASEAPNPRKRSFDKISSDTQPSEEKKQAEEVVAEPDKKNLK